VTRAILVLVIKTSTRPPRKQRARTLKLEEGNSQSLHSIAESMRLNVQLKRERLDMLAFATEDGEIDEEDSQMRREFSNVSESVRFWVQENRVRT
jgi:hypothetical protein